MSVPEWAHEWLARLAPSEQRALMLLAAGVRLTEAALAARAELDWPGSVRQLRNVIYRLAMFGEATTIGPRNPPPDQKA